jgi:hypothetical protein
VHTSVHTTSDRLDDPHSVDALFAQHVERVFVEVARADVTA